VTEGSQISQVEAARQQLENFQNVPFPMDNTLKQMLSMILYKDTEVSLWRNFAQALDGERTMLTDALKGSKSEE
jgi:hypothetical protein